MNIEYIIGVVIFSILFLTSIVMLIIFWRRSIKQRRELEQRDEKIKTLQGSIEELNNEITSYAEESIKNIEDKYVNILNKYKLSNDNYSTFFQYMQDRLKNSRIRMKEIDRRGSFESDDEVGFIFKTLYEISVDLADLMENVDVRELDQEYLNKKVKE